MVARPFAKGQCIIMATMSSPRPTPLRTAILAQVLGAIITASIIEIAYPKLFGSPLATAVMQGGVAAVVSYKLGAPKWWLPIHLGFLPAVFWASQVGIAPAWYLAGFALLLLIYWRTDQSQVPLYFSNAATAEAVAKLLPERPCHVADLGCGHGGLLRRLARARPDCEFLGIEHAPLPWLWAGLTSLGHPNMSVRLGDFWKLHLGLFDVVYVFLSPVPMSRLMAKARAEMRSGALLVSNSFAVPGLTPADIVTVADRRTTLLYCYRMTGE